MPGKSNNRPYSQKYTLHTSNASEQIVFREINGLVGRGRMLIAEAEAQGKKPNIWLVRYTFYAASLMKKLMNTRREAGLPLYRDYKRPNSRIKFTR